MVKKFEKGKYYRYTGKERLLGWNSDGLMDYVLDNKPRKCFKVSFGTDATFLENDDNMWTWNNGFDLWEECFINTDWKKEFQR